VHWTSDNIFPRSIQLICNFNLSTNYVIEREVANQFYPIQNTTHITKFVVCYNLNLVNLLLIFMYTSFCNGRGSTCSSLLVFIPLTYDAPWS